jgi:dipeptidyl aminopeptidase/acylaminoacyl peptidase
MFAFAEPPGEPVKRPFTPKDDVGLAQFQYAGRAVVGGVIKFSPNMGYFAVVTERGRLDVNAPEDTIWVFRTDEVEHYIQHPERGGPPAPLPLAQFATDRNGPPIDHVTWLPDSSGIAFTVLKSSSRTKFNQLFVADITSHSIKPLTAEDQDVTEFDVRSLRNYVYEAKSPVLLSQPKQRIEQPVVQTGKSIFFILFPEAYESTMARLAPFDAGLWAVVDSQRRRVLDANFYKASTVGLNLSLAPDGRSAVATLKVSNAPVGLWARYKAPTGYDKFHLPVDASAYYLIDLKSGEKKLLVNAPYGMNQDWHSYLVRAVWSADGKSLLLPNTFFPLDVTDPREIAERESHPYIAVLRLSNGDLSRVLPLIAGLDKERFVVKSVRFEDDTSVVVNFDRTTLLQDQPPAGIFKQQDGGGWRQGTGTEDPQLTRLSFKVEQREDMNQPPEIVATDPTSKVSRVIWDPNPQLKEIELSPTEVIHWKDDTGHEWEAGLIKPAGYVPGKRYPLVIQTHGFRKNHFYTNGSYTTAFAARALAAQGFAVVQMGWNENNQGTPKEASGEIAGYESLVKKLSNEGLVDPDRVGGIGFSRTVYHVLSDMTLSEHPFAAASVTDGVNFGYYQYMLGVDTGLIEENDRVNDGKPLGAEGLKNWMARAPAFNMDKVRTPLLIVEPYLRAVWADWEPYAALRFLKKPVDLIMLQDGTHVMTNPRHRLVSETLNVDWFRFWLKGEEDTDPAKAEQYKRWREQRKLQEDAKAPGGASRGK